MIGVGAGGWEFGGGGVISLAQSSGSLVCKDKHDIDYENCVKDYLLKF